MGHELKSPSPSRNSSRPRTTGRLLRALTLTLALPMCLGVGLQEAQAQPAAPAAEETPEERAKRIYADGDAAYAKGQYEEAIVAFEEVYALTRHPAIFYNLANANERLGNLDKARGNLMKYLPEAPAEERTLIEERIASLNKRIEKKRADEAAKAVPKPTVVAPVPTPKPVEPPPPPPPEPDTSVQTGGFVLLGVGAASTIVGAILGGVALGARGDAEEGCIEGICDAAVKDAVEKDNSMSLAADVTMGIGGALALTGIIMAIAGAPSDEEEASARLRITPTVLGGPEQTVAGGFISVRGSF